VSTPFSGRVPVEKIPLLLHLCCGPCATHAMTLLHREYHLIGFFCNPNIHPEGEYYRRLHAVATACRESRVSLWIPGYDSEPWENGVRDRDLDAEGEERCRICFQIRLETTALAAQRASIPCFATTLTVSPHKDSRVIHQIGKELAGRYGRVFLSEDFKKENGFHKSVQKSRELGLYRQKYCGCRFSI
jgi:epoxyqueuosine reductase